jgi:hypothetical protein
VVNKNPNFFKTEDGVVDVVATKSQAVILVDDHFNIPNIPKP